MIFTQGCLMSMHVRMSTLTLCMHWFLERRECNCLCDAMKLGHAYAVLSFFICLQADL